MTIVYRVLAMPLIALVWLVVLVICALLIALGFLGGIGVILWLELSDDKRDPLTIALKTTIALWG